MGGTSGIVAWKDRVMYVNLDTMRLVHDILGTCHVNRKTTQVAISVKYTRPRFENTNFFRAGNGLGAGSGSVYFQIAYSGRLTQAPRPSEADIDSQRVTVVVFCGKMWHIDPAIDDRSLSEWCLWLWESLPLADLDRDSGE